VAIDAGLGRFQGKSGPPGNLHVGPLMTQMRIANFHYAQQVDEKSRKIF
jgi:hypothetical protein